jgi:hypothetical protein
MKSPDRANGIAIMPTTSARYTFVMISQPIETRVLDWLGRHWKTVTFLAWIAISGVFILQHWVDIRTFELSDTDDNMRLMQVRGLLDGQGWFDLHQYRLAGSNIHWSRLVDLPIAGLILGLRPFIGAESAERWAVAIAPLLPYLLLLFSVALTVRRLIDSRAYAVAFVALFFAGANDEMFLPERIDHHGWQLALLALAVAGLADPKRLRGGITLGIATVLSLAVGLEMIIYVAIAGAAVAVFWVADRQERERLGTYAVSLAGGTALAYLVFASTANRGAVCDALSAVWLADALLGGALLFGLAWVSPSNWRTRLVLAIVAGILIAAFHAFMFPHCLHRLEGVSPEVDRLWLSHVSEARPVYSHDWQVATLTLSLPLTGTFGWMLLAWSRRQDKEQLRRVLAAAAPGAAATLLLFWQIRTAPAAQMLAVPGAAGLVWLLAQRAWNSGKAAIRVLGTCVIVIIGIGAAAPMALAFVPTQKQGATKSIDHANGSCNALASYEPIAQQPRGVVFTFIDLAPRLITVTRHDSITGPYHRNGQEIADVMNAFRGSEAEAHALIVKYHSTYVLTCPGSSETTIFMTEAPQGFYAQLDRGEVPAWLAPVELGQDSPFKLWRVIG